MDDQNGRIAELEAENAELHKRIEQIERQLQNIHQRRKKTRAASNPQRAKRDRRRTHAGSFRPEPPPDVAFVERDAHPGSQSKRRPPVSQWDALTKVAVVLCDWWVPANPPGFPSPVFGPESDRETSCRPF